MRDVQPAVHDQIWSYFGGLFEGVWRSHVGEGAMVAAALTIVIGREAASLCCHGK